jgi:hypothetical protein
MWQQLQAQRSARPIAQVSRHLRDHSRSSTAMGTHMHSRSQAALLPQGPQPALAASSCSSSSRLALGRRPRCLQEACELFAAKKLARRVLQAFREAVAAGVLGSWPPQCSTAGAACSAPCSSGRGSSRWRCCSGPWWPCAWLCATGASSSSAGAASAACMTRPRSTGSSAGAGGWCCCGTGGLQRGAMLTWHS